MRQFEQLVREHLIPEFCSDPNRNCEPVGFRENLAKLSERDAADFLRAWNGGLIEHQGRGQYRAAASSCNEQFFWDGLKNVRPRPFTLWLEPVITIAGLARLHFDYGWPKELIGTQSIDWAFDLVTFLPGEDTEFIAGEVKKSAKEIDTLLDLMKKFGLDPGLAEPTRSKERNAFKKVAGLRSREAPIFWALGPDGLSHVFQVRYRQSGILEFEPAFGAQLNYPA